MNISNINPKDIVPLPNAFSIFSPNTTSNNDPKIDKSTEFSKSNESLKKEIRNNTPKIDKSTDISKNNNDSLKNKKKNEIAKIDKSTEFSKSNESLKKEIRNGNSSSQKNIEQYSSTDSNSESSDGENDSQITDTSAIGGRKKEKKNYSQWLFRDTKKRHQMLLQKCQKIKTIKWFQMKKQTKTKGKIQ